MLKLEFEPLCESARLPDWCLQVAQSYGLLLGTIVMVPKTAQTLAAILMLTFILTGGYFVRGVCLPICSCLGWMHKEIKRKRWLVSISCSCLGSVAM